MIPPIVREVEQLGSHKYDINSVLSQQAAQLPAKLGEAAGAAKELTVGILNNVVEAVVVLTLPYFLLLDGAGMFQRATARVRLPERERVRRVGAG